MLDGLFAAVSVDWCERIGYFPHGDFALVVASIFFDLDGLLKLETIGDFFCRRRVEQSIHCSIGFFILLTDTRIL